MNCLHKKYKVKTIYWYKIVRYNVGVISSKLIMDVYEKKMKRKIEYFPVIDVWSFVLYDTNSLNLYLIKQKNNHLVIDNESTLEGI